MLGGTKQRYIWTVNGTLWSIIDSLAGTKILAEMYGDNFTSTWEIPENQFDAEFVEAKDLRYIADVGLHMPLAGYSTRLLDGIYAGASNQIRRSSDNMLLDIGFIDSYDYDVAAFNAHIGAGTGHQKIWYDQFGAIDNLQANNPDQPQVFSNTGSNGRPEIKYDGITQWMASNGLASNFSGNDNEWSIIALVKRNSVISNDTIWAASENSTTTPQVTDSFFTANEYRSFRRDDSGASQVNTVGIATINNYFIVASMFGNNTFYQLFNGVLTITPLADIGVITLNRFSVGAFFKAAALSLWDGAIDELIIWSDLIGTKQLTLSSYNMNQFYAVY